MVKDTERSSDLCYFFCWLIHTLSDLRLLDHITQNNHNIKYQLQILCIFEVDIYNSGISRPD